MNFHPANQTIDICKQNAQFLKGENKIIRIYYNSQISLFIRYTRLYELKSYSFQVKHYIADDELPAPPALTILVLFPRLFMTLSITSPV